MNFSKVLAFFLPIAAVQGTDLLVTVNCNGSSINQEIQIVVYDANYVQVSGVDATNQNGEFTIPSVEDYALPFNFFFYTSDGSICGAYPVYEDSSTVGKVELAYYPTTLPCSCANIR